MVSKVNTYRLGYSLFVPNSCDGDPAPILVPDAALAEVGKPPVLPNGNLPDPPEGGSIGEVAAVDEPERGALDIEGR